MPALRRASLRDQVLSGIREALITGQLDSGTVCSAAALAAELGVSHTPVREAMLALVDDGLMEVVPNRGYRPVTLSRVDLAEIAELRMFLEVPAAGLVAEKGVGERRAALEALVDEIEQTAVAGDVRGNLAADRRFHLTLVDACGNQRLTQHVARLRDQTRLYNIRRLAQSGALVVSAQEHRPLLAAVVAHDRPLAEALMRAHLGHITTDWSGEDDKGNGRKRGGRRA